MTEYSWIEDIDQFRGISAQWDEALAQSGNRNAFLLSDFINTWWKYFNKRKQLRVFAVSDGNRVVGGIPLFLEQGNPRYGFVKIMRYIGGPAANYTEPLYATPDTKVLPYLSDALAKRDDWDVLQLSAVPSKSLLIQEYQLCSGAAGFSLGITQSHINWGIDLSGGADEYLATLSSKLRRDLRGRRRCAVRQCGELSLKTIQGKEEVGHYFDLYVLLSQQSFRSRNRKSSFENRHYRDFFREFLTIMDEKQRLDGHVLLAGEKVLAVSFGYRLGNGFNWVLTAFNYDYKHVRPGYLLIEELIREIARRGETYYNWYGHDRFYKTQWCNRQSPLYRFVIISPTWRGSWYERFQRVEERLRSNEFILGLLRRARWI